MVVKTKKNYTKRDKISKLPKHNNQNIAGSTCARSSSKSSIKRREKGQRFQEVTFPIQFLLYFRALDTSEAMDCFKQKHASMQNCQVPADGGGGGGGWWLGGGRQDQRLGLFQLRPKALQAVPAHPGLFTFYLLSIQYPSFVNVFLLHIIYLSFLFLSDSSDLLFFLPGAEPE